MILEETGTPKVDTRGITTASIQDKVVNLLTDECHFPHEEIKDIFKQEQIKTSNASQSSKDCFRGSIIQPIYKKGVSIASLISKTKL